jgi:hypothetical protein
MDCSHKKKKSSANLATTNSMARRRRRTIIFSTMLALFSSFVLLLAPSLSAIILIPASADVLERRTVDSAGDTGQYTDIAVRPNPNCEGQKRLAMPITLLV